MQRDRRPACGGLVGLARTARRAPGGVWGWFRGGTCRGDRSAGATHGWSLEGGGLKCARLWFFRRQVGACRSLRCSLRCRDIAHQLLSHEEKLLRRYLTVHTGRGRPLSPPPPTAWPHRRPRASRRGAPGQPPATGRIPTTVDHSIRVTPCYHGGLDVRNGTALPPSRDNSCTWDMIQRMKFN